MAYYENIHTGEWYTDKQEAIEENLQNIDLDDVITDVLDGLTMQELLALLPSGLIEQALFKRAADDIEEWDECPAWFEEYLNEQVEYDKADALHDDFVCGDGGNWFGGCR